MVYSNLIFNCLSIIWLKVKIWLVVDFPFRKPHWYLPIILSVYSERPFGHLPRIITWCTGNKMQKLNSVIHIIPLAGYLCLSSVTKGANLITKRLKSLIMATVHTHKGIRPPLNSYTNYLKTNGRGRGKHFRPHSPTASRKICWCHFS
jgi:hypothetical protein